MHATWPQVALLATLLFGSALGTPPEPVCECASYGNEYKWAFFLCMPVILLLGGVIGFLICRDNKLKDTLKKDLLAVDNDADGELDSTLTKTIRFMDKVSQARYCPIFKWKEWAVEAYKLRKALLTNQDLHQPNNFREKLMKKYNTEAKNKDTSEIVRFLIQNNTELRSVMEDTRTSPLSLQSTTSGVDFEADANIRIAKVLQTVNKQHNIAWDTVCRSFFVDFSVAADAPQGVLVAATMVVLYRFNLFALTELNDNDMSRFLAKVEQGYLDNPYHNAAHAADVTARLGTILHTSGIARRLLCKGELGAVKLLAVILAAAIHDYEHPGHTNQYSVVMGLKQAKIYNDKTVYENWSLYRSLAFMDMPCYPFVEFPFRMELRTNIINFVLATDMSSHFDVVGNAKNTLSGLICEDGIDFLEIETKHQDFILQLALKVADLGHTATPVSQHIRWVKRLQEEFFAQGDMERNNNIKISPLMDRTKAGPCKGSNQVGFFEVIVIPLYKLWMLMFPSCTPLLVQVTKNLEFWQNHPGDPPEGLLEASLSEKNRTQRISVGTLIDTIRTGNLDRNSNRYTNSVRERSQESFDTYNSYSKAAHFVAASTAMKLPETIIDVECNGTSLECDRNATDHGWQENHGKLKKVMKMADGTEERISSDTDVTDPCLADACL